RGNLLLFLSIDDLGRRLRHDDDDTGLDAVGAPKLLAVYREILSIGRRLGAGGHRGRVRADALLGKREGGDFARGDAGEELFLLLLRAEEDEGLRHANRLVR